MDINHPNFTNTVKYQYGGLTFLFIKREPIMMKKWYGWCRKQKKWDYQISETGKTLRHLHPDARFCTKTY